MAQKHVKKNLISPQWLRNIKAKKYPIWRFDLLFSKKKIFRYFFCKGWRLAFHLFKTPDDLEKKLLNFAHHYEYQKKWIKYS